MTLKELAEKYPQAKRWRELINSNGGTIPEAFDKEFTAWAISEEGKEVMLKAIECESGENKNIRKLTGGGKRWRKAHWRTLGDDEPCQVGDVIGWRCGLGALITSEHWALGLSRNQWKCSKPLNIYRRKEVS